jgi:hypothetical protein
MTDKEIIMLISIGVLGFVQNMAGTWASRSRNQQDVEHHRWAAIASNGIYFLVSALIWGQLWSSMTTGGFWKIVATGLVYTISTSEGSVAMMRFLIKRGR